MPVSILRETITSSITCFSCYCFIVTYDDPKQGDFLKNVICNKMFFFTLHSLQRVFTCKLVYLKTSWASFYYDN